MRMLVALVLLLGPGAVVEPPVVEPSVVEPVETTPAVGRPDLVAALAVLRGWDVRRARAWAASDPGALRRLYVPGSAAGRADLRLLAAYRARQTVVRRLVTQVFDVRVLRRDSRWLRLRVVDRVAGGVVVRAGTEAPLASSRPTVRVVDLRRGGAVWRVAEVSGSGGDPRAGQR